MFLLPCSSTVRQADLVRVSVVSKLPATFCRDTEPHDPLHSVTCENHGNTLHSNSFKVMGTHAKNTVLMMMKMKNYALDCLEHFMALLIIIDVWLDF